MTKKKTDGEPHIDCASELAAETVDVPEEDIQNDSESECKTPKSECELLNEKLAEENDKYLRLLAEFDNFRKRTSEQFLRIRQDGIAYAIEVIFPALDSMDRAINCVDEANKEGILLIKKQLETALSTLGVEEIGENNVAFDPNIHHAVMRVEDEENSGKVTEVFQKGYRFKDRTIRCAMVKVAE
jgi:molecular chaperone GrpE